MKYLILALFAGLITYALSGDEISLAFSDYKETLSALLNISSIIFAIVGAWIAIIYPRAIGRAFLGGDKKEASHINAEADSRYLSELVEIVLVSAAVLMVVLSIQFLAPILRTSNWHFPGEVSRHALLFTISLLTLAQLQAIFRVILANYFFLGELRKKNANDRIDSLHR